MLRAGGGIEAKSGFGRGGFEFQQGFAALPGLSVFADAGPAGIITFMRWLASASISATIRRLSAAIVKTIRMS